MAYNYNSDFSRSNNDLLSMIYDMAEFDSNNKEDEKIYYFSNYDNQIHNINDLENYNKNDDTVELVDYKGFVIDEVTLHTLDEIIKIVLNK